MAYQEINEVVNTSEGLHTILIYVQHVVPIFIPMLLLGFFLIIALASYFSQKRLTGEGDFAGSFTVAGFTTTVLSVIMSVIPNLVNITYVIIPMVLTLIGVLWLYFSSQKAGGF